jgi:hypothetical protein
MELTGSNGTIRLKRFSLKRNVPTTLLGHGWREGAKGWKTAVTSVPAPRLKFTSQFKLPFISSRILSLLYS